MKVNFKNSHILDTNASLHMKGNSEKSKWISFLTFSKWTKINVQKKFAKIALLTKFFITMFYFYRLKLNDKFYFNYDTFFIFFKKKSLGIFLYFHISTKC